MEGFFTYPTGTIGLMMDCDTRIRGLLVETKSALDLHHNRAGARLAPEYPPLALFWAGASQLSEL